MANQPNYNLPFFNPNVLQGKNVPKPAQNMSAIQYFLTLSGQGFNPQQAYFATMQNYGPQAQAKNRSQSALAGLAGNILGMVGGHYAGQGLSSLFSSPTGVEMPTQLGGANALGSQGAGFTSGEEMVGNGLYSEAPGSMLMTPVKGGAGAAEGTTTVETGTGLGGETALGEYFIPGVGIVAGGYGGYKTAQELGNMPAGSQRTKTGAIGGAASGAATGAGVGTLIAPGIGTAIGAGIGALVGGTAGAAGSWFGSHKGKAQVMRDHIRGVLQQNNVLDENWQGTLADGSKYDFGKDGKSMKWSEIDKVSSKQPKAWNSAVPLADALAASYGFVGQKASDIAAWYAKGAVSNAKDDPFVAVKNMQHFAQQQGITFDQVKSKLDQAIADNRINQNQYDYYLNGAQQLTGGNKSQPIAIQPKAPAPLPPNQPRNQFNASQSVGNVLRQKMGTY